MSSVRWDCAVLNLIILLVIFLLRSTVHYSIRHYTAPSCTTLIYTALTYTLLYSTLLHSLSSHQSTYLKVGDRLRLDVQNYRPERILFARAVRLKSYRKLGRETGVVCGVRDQGFGFVRSDIRDFNIFFRLSEVIGEGGVPAREGCITVGSCLSFDVAEETRGVPNTKLRAVRVQLLPPDTASSPSYLSVPSVEGLNIDQDHSMQGRVSPEEQSGGSLTLIQVREASCPVLFYFHHLFLLSVYSMFSNF